MNRKDINKRIVDEVIELGKSMDELYENQLNEYKGLLKILLGKKEAAEDNLKNSRVDTFEKALLHKMFLNCFVEALENELKKQKEERDEIFKHEVEMIRCKLDSDYRREYNINKAREINEMNRKIRNNQVIKVERSIVKNDIKKSGLKRTTKESRLSNSMKLKYKHPLAKPY